MLNINIRPRSRRLLLQCGYAIQTYTTVELQKQRGPVGATHCLTATLDALIILAGNAIRSAIIDAQPFSGFLNATDLQRSDELLQIKPPLLSDSQFKVMKDLIKKGVPQMEFAWVSSASTRY